MLAEANTVSRPAGTPISPLLQERIEVLVTQLLADVSALYEEGLTKQVALLTIERDELIAERATLIERVRFLEGRSEGRSPA